MYHLTTALSVSKSVIGPAAPQNSNDTFEQLQAVGAMAHARMSVNAPHWTIMETTEAIKELKVEVSTLSLQGAELTEGKGQGLNTV